MNFSTFSVAFMALFVSFVAAAPAAAPNAEAIEARADCPAGKTWYCGGYETYTCSCVRQHATS